MAILRKTDRSRQQILDAANAAFRELGFSGTSMEEIARRAGLTRKTVYNLFGSKEDVALSLIARAEAMDAGYRSRIAGNQDAVEILERVLLDSAGWCLENPELARIALAPSRRPTLEPPGDRPSFQGLVRDILLLGQRQARIRVDESAEFMALLLLAVYGQAMLNALPEGRIAGSEIRKIIRLILEGIGAASNSADN